jgi:hypothetical protein
LTFLALPFRRIQSTSSPVFFDHAPSFPSLFELILPSSSFCNFRIREIRAIYELRRVAFDTEWVELVMYCSRMVYEGYGCVWRGDKEKKRRGKGIECRLMEGWRKSRNKPIKDMSVTQKVNQFRQTLQSEQTGGIK